MVVKNRHYRSFPKILTNIHNISEAKENDNNFDDSTFTKKLFVKKEPQTLRIAFKVKFENKLSFILIIRKTTRKPGIV